METKFARNNNEKPPTRGKYGHRSSLNILKKSISEHTDRSIENTQNYM